MASSSRSEVGGAARAPRAARIGLLVALACAGFAALDTPPQQWLRHQGFDALARVLPRDRSAEHALVVAIDEATLQRGQWPRPRDQLARLIGNVAQGRPAAIDLDVIMPEPDATSPPALAGRLPPEQAVLAAQLRALPDHDEQLGFALLGNKVVLGVAGVHFAVAGAAAMPRAPLRVDGDRGGLAALPHYEGALRSRPPIEQGADGHAVLNQELDGDTVRRMLTLARVGDVVLPSPAVELLRVAAGGPLDLKSDAGGLRALRVAGIELPLPPDGRVWLRYGRHKPRLYHSAGALLDAPADPAVFGKGIVLVALTGLGLADQVITPLGERVPGIELHLQFLENLLDGTWLQRPAWTAALEPLLLLVCAGLLALAVPRLRPPQAFAMLAGVLAALAGGALAAYVGGLLLDAVTPVAGATLAFAATLGATLAESQRALHAQREAAARVAGEFAAARRVQLGMLPEPARVLAGEARVAVAAAVEPARNVGGDFYDLFRLDARRLCVLIGDVSDKGLHAALFMALVRARCQGALQRHPGDLAAAMAEFEAALSGENPESMFVTLFVVVIDLEDGSAEFCNCGHEPGLLLDGAGGVRLLESGSPPAGVMPGLGVEVERFSLAPGMRLVLVTDGVTEAADARGALYGRERLRALLCSLRGADAAATLRAVRGDVGAFAAGAEPADDLAVVVIECIRIADDANHK